ncbi:MAG: DUF423 domain-containing protein [Pontibacterium sp.]
MPTRFFLFCASVSGFTAVALGAFGAHGLRGRLPSHLMDVFQTAVQYQFYHTLALLAVVLLACTGVTYSERALSLAGWGFLIGILLFSGSLYLLALTGTHWLGAVTPIGGLAFLTGWAALFYTAFKLTRNQINAN